MSVAVGRLDEFGLGTAKRVRVEGVDVAIVNTEEGLFAIEDRCSHADVALSEGEIVDCTIECWLHGSAFDLRTGEPLSLPANVPVPVYSVYVDESSNDVLVDIHTSPLMAKEKS